MTPTEAKEIIKVGADKRLEQISLTRIAKMIDVDPKDFRKAVDRAVEQRLLVKRGAPGKLSYAIGKSHTTTPHSHKAKAHTLAFYDWARAFKAEGYTVTLPEERLRKCMACDNTFQSTHKGNRLCPTCSRRASQSVAECSVVA